MGMRNAGILIVAGIFCFSFSIYYGHIWWNSGLAGFMVGCLIFGCIGLFLSLENQFINKLGVFFGSRTAHWSLRETLESDMAQVRFSKMKQDYATALDQINHILHLDPTFPEALFLKAQILWEGYQKAEEAKATLQLILKQPHGVKKDGPQKEDTVLRWASSLYDNLCRAKENGDSNNRVSSVDSVFL